MTCGSCLSKVREALLGVSGITRAEVSLLPPQAIVSMTSHVNTSALAKAVAGAGHFTLSEADHGMAHVAEVPAQEERASFKPIYLLFAYIAGAATLVELVHGGFEPMRWMGAFMAAFFITFSFFKMLDVRGFAEGYSTYDIVAKHVPAYGLAYPFIELALGIAYVLAPLSPITNATALIVMAVSSVGVTQSVLRNSPFQCACLGTIFKLPLSRITLVEDLLMVVMSVVMLLFATIE
jgi:copper chaperone CopZ